jgi:NitT/TauT family transport system substrate-binding protein
MVGKSSNIQTIADLKGKKIGIVGGPLDKNWLLLRAYAQEKFGLDLDKHAEKVFGAPPLLNQQLADNQLDALVNFWHYSTKLENQGYRRLMDGRDIVKGLGIEEPMPNLGYVFKQSWAQRQGDSLTKFFDASKAARAMLCSNDEAWAKIAPLTQETDAKLQAALRSEYCAGSVQHWTTADRVAADRIYRILRKTGGEEMTGKAEGLPMEIFWPYELKAMP